MNILMAVGADQQEILVVVVSTPREVDQVVLFEGGKIPLRVSTLWTEDARQTQHLARMSVTSCSTTFRGIARCRGDAPIHRPRRNSSYQRGLLGRSASIRGPRVLVGAVCAIRPQALHGGYLLVFPEPALARP